MESWNPWIHATKAPLRLGARARALKRTLFRHASAKGINYRGMSDKFEVSASTARISGHWRNLFRLMSLLVSGINTRLVT